MSYQQVIMSLIHLWLWMVTERKFEGQVRLRRWEEPEEHLKLKLSDQAEVPYLTEATTPYRRSSSAHQPAHNAPVLSCSAPRLPHLDLCSGLNNWIMNQAELRGKNKWGERQSLRSEKDRDSLDWHCCSLWFQQTLVNPGQTLIYQLHLHYFLSLTTRISLKGSP